MKGFDNPVTETHAMTNSRLSTVAVAIILTYSVAVALAAIADIIRPNQLGLFTGAIAASSLAYLTWFSPRRGENSFIGYLAILGIGIGTSLTSARAVYVGEYLTRIESFGYIILLALTVMLFVAMLAFSGDADEVITDHLPEWADPNVRIDDVFSNDEDD